MNGRLLTKIGACFALLIFSNMANAVLVDRGGGLKYDTDFNITWFPSSQDISEHIYIDIVNYANNATHYDSVRNVTYSNWRLPRTLNSDPSCNQIGARFLGCTGSELGHLFNELGRTPTRISNPGSIGSFGHHSFLWSETPFTNNIDYNWAFDFESGEQFILWTFDDVFYGGGTWLVSDGDIAAIPVPATVWLFGSGLIGLFATARRKHQG